MTKLKKISVVMASYLGFYDGCATDREVKFKRAINSFLGNSYENKELIIVSDGCDITGDILIDEFKEYLDSGLLKYYYIKKQPIFSGNVRSLGLKKATGDYIIYLDTDDLLGSHHILSIASQIKDLDWGYYNDWVSTQSGLQSKLVELEYGKIGTSSIFHKNNPNLNWDNCNGYGHDFKFVEKLIKWSKNNDKIYGTSYIICHIPYLVNN